MLELFPSRILEEPMREDAPGALAALLTPASAERFGRGRWPAAAFCVYTDRAGWPDFLRTAQSVTGARLDAWVGGPGLTRLLPDLHEALAGAQYPEGLPAWTELPEQATEALLVPGSVLWLPRGTYHETRGEGDVASAALVVQLELPSDAEVLLSYLRRYLVQDERWRVPVAMSAASGADTIRGRCSASCRVFPVRRSWPVPPQRPSGFRRSRKRPTRRWDEGALGALIAFLVREEIWIPLRTEPYQP
jgi:hypothetical protein